MVEIYQPTTPLVPSVMSCTCFSMDLTGLCALFLLISVHQSSSPATGKSQSNSQLLTNQKCSSFVFVSALFWLVDCVMAVGSSKAVPSPPRLISRRRLFLTLSVLLTSIARLMLHRHIAASILSFAHCPFVLYVSLATGTRVVKKTADGAVMFARRCAI